MPDGLHQCQPAASTVCGLAPLSVPLDAVLLRLALAIVERHPLPLDAPNAHAWLKEHAGNWEKGEAA